MLSSRFFDNDPFFEGHENHMREMDRFFRDPFAAFHGRLGIEDSSDRRRGGGHRGRGDDGGREVASRSLFDMGGFDNMFSHMQGVMENMRKNFDKVSSSSPDGHVMSHSSFASYSNVGGSEPKYFQATSSTQQAPGGVRETRKTLRNSATGQEKMAIGRYIGDKGHVIQRNRNRGADIEENQNFINLGEDEAGEFEQEWKERTHQLGQGRQIDRGRDRRGADRDQRRPRPLKM